ncbi:MAG: CotH kinase family protein [Clostridia bacterium]|nr:CotH kinase family protein [Clostridia bacterium]
MFKRILAVLLLLSLFGCRNVSDDGAEPAETLPPAESVPAETAPEETEPEEFLFPDAFEAKRALLRLEDLPLPMKYYTNESYAWFKIVRENAAEELRQKDLTQAEIEALYRKVLAARNSLRIVRGDTPRVYILSNSGVGWGYSACSAIVVTSRSEKFKVVYDEHCEISLRGNSTAGAEKPPYNLRFSERVSLLGMDRGRKWSLLANLYDKSLMRNYVAYHLGERMGLPYTSGCRFVEVYLNGVYQGNYTLLEPVTDGRGRVEIDPENGDFLFEVDMNRNDGSYYLVPKHGQRMKVNKPERVDSEGRSYLKTFFDSMDEALMTHDIEQYGQYIDVESFADFYIHGEITKSIDVYDFSTRYFLKDGKLYAGPIWDYDLSMGNVSARCNEDKYFTYCNVRDFGTNSGDSAEGEWMDHYWFHELLEDPAFRGIVLERFRQLYPVFENLYQDNEEGQCLIDWLMERYGDSFRRNYEEGGWDELRRYSGLAKDQTLPFEEEVEWLKDWLRRRTEWVGAMIEEKCAP